jgi:hypothetical protein
MEPPAAAALPAAGAGEELPGSSTMMHSPCAQATSATAQAAAASEGVLLLSQELHPLSEPQQALTPTPAYSPELTASVSEMRLDEEESPAESSQIGQDQPAQSEPENAPQQIVAPPAEQPAPPREPRKFSQNVVNAAFFEACLQGNLEQANLLVSAFGADPNHSTASGVAALHAAALEGRLDIVRCVVGELCPELGRALGVGMPQLGFARLFVRW